jgi:excisionase family DNA binding protein
MNISYDRGADAAYLKLSNLKITKTKSVSDFCNVDLDAEGHVVGIELLSIKGYAADFRAWLGIESAAEYLNKSPLTLRRWIKKGEISSYKIGKEYQFIKEELDEFIQRNRRADLRELRGAIKLAKGYDYKEARRR